jgi:hypothetical protein
MNDLLTFTVDNNDVTFTDEVKSDSESLVKKARLFYVGTHKGRSYSAGDLKKVADSFEEVPLQLDRIKSARDTVGIVRKRWPGSSRMAGSSTASSSSSGGILWKKCAWVSGKSCLSG